jgi:archaellum component FlaC
MEVEEAIRAVLRELILPELDRMKEENRETRSLLSLMNQRLDDVNKRLDDVNLHLADQSRRIDASREELSHRIDETNNRIDKTNTRIDRLYEVIVRRDEHVMVTERVAVPEQEVNELKRQLAA